MHAEIARELRQSGDPFALTLAGVRYVDKPPLLYALIAIASSVLGDTELAARVPSALAALVAVGVTTWLGVRLLGPGGGIVAGLALAGSAGFFAYGRYVRPETLLVAALASGFALVLVGLLDDRRALVGGGVIAFGLAGLAKDPLAALLPPLAIAIALAPGGRARPVRSWLPWWSAAAAIALAVGWWILVEIRTPGFVWYTVVDNHLLNVARARHFPDEDVPLGAMEFLLVAGLGAAPWVLGAGVSVLDLIRRRAWRDPDEMPWMALALWAAGVFTLTALSPFRLPHYGLPAYPMLALLAARAWQSGAARWLVPVHAVAFAVVGAGAAIAWASDGSWFLESVMPMADVATRKAAVTGAASSVPAWDGLRPLLGWTALVGMTAASALGAVSLQRVPRRAVIGAAVTIAAVLALMPAVAAALSLVSAHRAVKPLAAEVRQRWRAGDALVHEGPLENSGALEWYAGQRPAIVDGRTSVLGFGATLDGTAFWDDTRLRSAWTGAGRVWLVTTRAEARSVVQRLPDARLVAAAGGRRLYVNRAD